MMKKSLLERNLIASGGFAKVYKISYLGETYAAKEMESKDPLMIIDSLDEIKIVFQASSEFVVPTHWVLLLKTKNLSYQIIIIMDFFGTSLFEVLNQPQSFENTIQDKKMMFFNLVAGVNQFLKFSNDSYIIHGDIKPNNILLEAIDKRVHKIYYADFGIACLMPRNNDSQEIKGLTPGYASPEQIEKSIVTKRSDIYSVGLVGLEIFFRRLTEDEKIGLKKSEESLELIWKNILDEAISGNLPYLKIIRQMIRLDWNKRPDPSIILDLLNQIE